MPQLPWGSQRGGHRVGLGQLQSGTCHLALPGPWVFRGLHDNGLGTSFPIIFSTKAQNQCWGSRHTFTPSLPFLDPPAPDSSPSLNPYLTWRGPTRATIGQTSNPRVGSTSTACYRQTGHQAQLSSHSGETACQRVRPSLSPPGLVPSLLGLRFPICLPKAPSSSDIEA